ncbi:MAG: flippase [Burkholderiaceae bacterium]|nr:flippase [Burkholderiaceae bacterium]
MKDGGMLRPSLLSGTAWNLLGLVVPLFVAVIAIPWLMALLGLERFGFLALVWALVGYASVLDLGIGKTLIRLLSQRLGERDREGALALATLAAQLLTLIGLTLALALALVSGTVLNHAGVWSSLPTDEVPGALAWVAAILPLVLLNSAQVSVLSAFQDFRRLNLLRAMLSTLTYLAPLMLAFNGATDLRAVVGSLLAVRLAGLLAYGWVCWRDYGWLPRPGGWSRERLTSLMAVGRWMFIANLAGPLMTYLDRFVVGLQLPLRDVAVYAAPGEIPNRLLMVPYALLAAMFPRVAAAGADATELRRVLGQSVRWLCALMTPLVLVGVAFAMPAMTAWLGSDHGPRAGVVLQVLLAGLWLSSLSMGPVTVVQAAGDLRHIALFYLVQVPLLLTLLWGLTGPLGIVGAALAVALRQGVDTVGMLWLAVRQVGLPPGRWGRFALGLLGSAAVLLMAAMARGWAEAALAALAGLVACGVLGGWLWVEPDERRRLLHGAGQRWRRTGEPPAAG